MRSAWCASGLLLAGLVNAGAPTRASRIADAPSASRWHRVPVRMLARVPRGAVDSIITVRERDDHHIIVMYTFDNPCGDRVIARTRRVHDTIAVRFTLVPRMPESPRLELVIACSAKIEYRTYAVDVGRRAADTVIVRTMYGRDSTWVDLPQRTVTVAG